VDEESHIPEAGRERFDLEFQQSKKNLDVIV
jgi:hypothetical protein